MQFSRAYTGEDSDRDKPLDLIEQGRYDVNVAWRLAAETWLLDNGFITVSNRRKGLPYSPENQVHDQLAGTRTAVRWTSYEARADATEGATRKSAMS